MHPSTPGPLAADRLPKPEQANHPLFTVASLMVSDLCALSLCSVLAVSGYLALRGDWQPLTYARLWPCLLLFLMCYEIGGLYHGVALYPGVALGPAEELRRLTISTTIGYLLLGVATFLSKKGPVYSRGVFLIAWTLSLVALPVFRGLTRRLFAGRRWWGIRCVVFGAGESSRRVIEVLLRRPEFGLKPVAVFGAAGGNAVEELHGIPVARPYEAAVPFANRERISYAILAEPALPAAELLRILEEPGRHFRHILVMPELFGESGVWATARDVGTLFGLEIRQNLLLPLSRAVKRCVDLVLILALAPAAIPLAALLAVLVRLTSTGPAFFRQTRMGQGNRTFGMWKFRTMYADSEQILQQHLDRDPDARREWTQHHKLANDPRVTPFGRFLRTTSLDELPQLFNVLNGEMSVVGPRPIVPAEVAAYGQAYELYQRVPPGLTGLWQVSGRNSIPFRERVELDAYYVRSWSIWLDAYILMHTLPAVLRRQGAF